LQRGADGCEVAATRQRRDYRDKSSSFLRPEFALGCGDQKRYGDIQPTAVCSAALAQAAVAVRNVSRSRLPFSEAQKHPVRFGIESCFRYRKCFGCAEC